MRSKESSYKESEQESKQQQHRESGTQALNAAVFVRAFNIGSAIVGKLLSLYSLDLRLRLVIKSSGQSKLEAVGRCCVV